MPDENAPSSHQSSTCIGYESIPHLVLGVGVGGIGVSHTSTANQSRAFVKGGCTQKVSKNRGLKESVVGIPNKMNVNERRIPLGRIGKTRE